MNFTLNNVKREFFKNSPDCLVYYSDREIKLSTTCCSTCQKVLLNTRQTQICIQTDADMYSPSQKGSMETFEHQTETEHLGSSQTEGDERILTSLTECVTYHKLSQKQRV